MNRQDANVLRAVRRALPAIAEAIDLVRDRLAQGGRLIYVGTGTSGRIGALDASECPPTFGADPADDPVRDCRGSAEAALRMSRAHPHKASESQRRFGGTGHERHGRAQARQERCGRGPIRQRPNTLHDCGLEIRAKKRRRHHRGRLQPRLGAGEGLARSPSKPRSAPKCSPDRPA